MKGIIAAALLFLSTCCFSQNISFSLFPPVRTIGADEYAPVHYQFKWPRFLLKRNGHIFVTDHAASEIRVFDENWEYVRRIGGTGQGPGEFANISQVRKAINGDILVYDVRNRRLTQYGAALDEPVSRQMQYDPLYINRLCEDTYLVYEYDRIRKEQKPSDHVLYVYDGHFDKPLTSMGAIESFWDISQPFMRTQPGDFGSSLTICIINESLFFATPYFYEGKIVSFRKNADKWVEEIFNGHSGIARSFREVQYFDPSKYDPEKNRPVSYYYTAMDYTDNKRYSVQRLHFSLGLFQLASGELAHFSMTHKKGELWVLQLELFETDGQFIGWGEFDVTDAGIDFIQEILYIDEQNRLYVTGLENDAAVIRVMQLEVH